MSEAYYMNLVKHRDAEIARLKELLFERGAMESAPCFACGYNGPGYYQPSSHPCAERHHHYAALRGESGDG